MFAEPPGPGRVEIAPGAWHLRALPDARRTARGRGRLPRAWRQRGWLLHPDRPRRPSDERSHAVPGPPLERAARIPTRTLPIRHRWPARAGAAGGARPARRAGGEARPVSTSRPTCASSTGTAATSRMGLHQDKDESAGSLAAGLPVVSFSIGDSGALPVRRSATEGSRRED